MECPALDGGNWRGLIPHPQFEFTHTPCNLQAPLFAGEGPKSPV